MKHKSGKTIWFTGLSGSGKSTLSELLQQEVEARGISVVLLDGDILRKGLNRDLGFSALDRAENIRRAGEVAKILSDTGHTVIAAFITPLESIRRALRSIFDPERYVEVFLDCSLEVCEARDPKGLYRRARAGEIPEFTGVSAPFEEPGAPDLVVPTGNQIVEESLEMVLNFLEWRFPDLVGSQVVTPAAASRGRSKKVAIIGLDGAPPSLIFGDAGKELINLRALMDHGVWGALRSTDPPITVPAWTTMTTGKDPGELGLYGFRNRVGNAYEKLAIVDASHVTEPRVWEYLERAGKTSILLAVPQTYPPRAHKGVTITDFLSPQVDMPATHPPELVDELHSIAGGRYLTDVKDFRTEDKDSLLNNLYSMVDRRFRVAADFVLHRPWDFFMMVEIGTDRLHHAFWKYCHADHPLHEPGNPYQYAIREFYRYLDGRIGALLALLDDETTVLVVSDHGSRSLRGGVCINDWLMRNGYLVLKTIPETVTDLDAGMVDWSKTKAWSEGGYYARIFLNVKGREPEGIIEAAHYNSFRDELAGRLTQMKCDASRIVANRIFKPEAIYRTCRNSPPDLMVYFDDLNLRSIGTVGNEDIFCAANDKGPDDANHDPEGILIAARMCELRQGIRRGTQVFNASVEDITPTILSEFGLPTPKELQGKAINLCPTCSAPAPKGHAAWLERVPPKHDKGPSKGYTSEEEELMKKRLADLGYI